MAKPAELVHGTLDLLILKTISLDPRHGWAIAKRIPQVSQETLQVQQGSLYPVLHRPEHSLAGAGRKQLERELANWTRLSAAIDLVIQEA